MQVPFPARPREADPLCEAFQQLTVSTHNTNYSPNTSYSPNFNYSPNVNHINSYNISNSNSSASGRVLMTEQELQEMIESALSNTLLPPTLQPGGAPPPLSPSPNGWPMDDTTAAPGTATAATAAAAATATAGSVGAASGIGGGNGIGIGSCGSELMPVVSYGWLQWSADPAVAIEQERALYNAARCAEYQRQEAAAVQELAELRAARRRRRSTTATAATATATATDGISAIGYSVRAGGDSSTDGRQWRVNSGNSNSSYTSSGSGSSGSDGTVASLEYSSYSSSGDAPHLPRQPPRQQLLLGPALLHSVSTSSSLDSGGSCSSECFSVHESSSIRQLSGVPTTGSAMQQQQQQQQAAEVSLFSWSMGEATPVTVVPTPAIAAPATTAVAPAATGMSRAVGDYALTQRSRLQDMEVDELASVQLQQQEGDEQAQQQREKQRSQPLLCRAMQHAGTSNWAVLACMFL
jgi:hypothetical protein